MVVENAVSHDLFPSGMTVDFLLSAFSLVLACLCAACFVCLVAWMLCVLPVSVSVAVSAPA